MAIVPKLISATGRLANKIEISWNVSSTKTTPPFEPAGEHGLAYGTTTDTNSANIVGGLFGYGTFSSIFSSIPSGTYYVWAWAEDPSLGINIFSSQRLTVSVVSKGYELSQDGLAIANPILIANGTEGNNKVLSSDPGGNVSWRDISSLHSSKRYIGELYGGGVVADIWNEGGEEVVLIASLEDLRPIAGDYAAASANPESTSPYNNRISSFFYQNGAASASHYVGTSSQSNYDGMSNTLAILGSQALASSTGSAAEVAASHRGGGYSDWYLPSYYELNAVYKNANAISKSLGREFMFPIKSSVTFDENSPQYLGYWSSTEVNVASGGNRLAYRIWLAGHSVSTKAFYQRIKAVRKEGSKAGNGMILNLDATKEESFSESAFYTYGTASRWSCLANQNLSATYSFALRSSGSVSGTYQGMPGADVQIASFASLGQSQNASGKISVFTFTNVDTMDSTKAKLFNNGSPSSILSDYVLISLEQAEVFFVAANSSAVGNPVADAALLRVYASEILPSGQASQYRIIGEIIPTYSLGYKIPLWQFKGKRVSVKIEAPYANLTNVSGMGFLTGGPSITNLIITGYNGYRRLGPIFLPDQGGFLGLSRSGAVDAGGSATGSYIDFSAPVGDSTTATVEMWAKLKGQLSDNQMMFSWNNYDVWAANGGFGYNTFNADIYGISTAEVAKKGIFNNWKHFVFEMKAGSELGPTPSFLQNNKIYINGERQTLSQISGTPTFSRINFNGGLGRIGGAGRNGGATTYLANMDLAVFRVYNRALSKDEIMLNFESERKRYEIRPSILRDGLYSHIDFNSPASYSGDGSASGVIADIGDAGRTASLVITPTTTVPAVQKTSNAFPLGVRRLIFPGSTNLNPYITWATSGTPLQSATDISVSFWIYFDEARTAEIIVKWASSSEGVGPWEVFQSTLAEGSAITFRLISGGTIYQRTGTKVIPNAKWTHFCATYNNVSKKIRTYINSEIDIDHTWPSQMSMDTAIAGDVFVGQYPPTATTNRYPLKGSISNMQIYTRTLDKEEVRNNYDADKFKFDDATDANLFFSHELTGNPTFSIRQNLQLDIPGRYADRILVSRASGESVWADKKYVFPDKKEKKRKIGDLYGGGIIVGTWKYPSNTNNYLIMSTADLTSDAGVAFSNVISVASGANSEFDGAANSAKIVAQAGHSTSAAKLCRDYVANGYSGWHLPSAQEMMMALNAGEIVGYVFGKNDFAEYGYSLPRGRYWTSTEARETNLGISYSTAFDIGYSQNDRMSGPLLKSTLASVRAFRVAAEIEDGRIWADSWDPAHVPIDWKRPAWATKISIDPNFKFDYSMDGWDVNPVGSGTISAVATRGFASFTFSNVISTSETIVSAGICWATSSTYPIIPTIENNVAYATGPTYSLVATGKIFGNPVGLSASAAQATEARIFEEYTSGNPPIRSIFYQNTPFRIFLRAFARTESGKYYYSNDSRIVALGQRYSGNTYLGYSQIDIPGKTYSANGTSYAYPAGVLTYVHPYSFYNRN